MNVWIKLIIHECTIRIKNFINEKNIYERKIKHVYFSRIWTTIKNTNNHKQIINIQEHNNNQ